MSAVSDRFWRRADERTRALRAVISTPGEIAAGDQAAARHAERRGPFEQRAASVPGALAADRPIAGVAGALAIAAERVEHHCRHVAGGVPVFLVDLTTRTSTCAGCSHVLIAAKAAGDHDDRQPGRCDVCLGPADTWESLVLLVNGVQLAAAACAHCARRLVGEPEPELGDGEGAA